MDNKPIKTPFANPWKDLDKDDLHKTTVEVSRAVMSNITRVHSKQGVLQTTIYLLITKLTNELERNGITDYDPAAYERGVAGCRIILDLPGRSTIIESPAEQLNNRATEAVSGNDRPRGPGLAQPAPGPSAAPNPNVSPRKRGNSKPRRAKVEGEKGSGSEGPK